LSRVRCVPDRASSRSQVDDPLRPAQWLGGRRSGRSHHAEILPLRRHRQRRQPHGVHRKTYDYVSSCGIPLMHVVYQVVEFERGDGRHSGRHRRSVVYSVYSVIEIYAVTILMTFSAFMNVIGQQSRHRAF